MEMLLTFLRLHVHTFSKNQVTYFFEGEVGKKPLSDMENGPVQRVSQWS